MNKARSAEEPKKAQVPLRLRILLPPAGIWSLWRSERPLLQKLAGTCGLLLVLLFYVAATIAALVRFTGLEIEWRGGYLPALTYRKTAPNYAAVEASRHHQPTPANPQAQPDTAAITSTKTEIASGNPTSYWVAFRGPRGDGIYTDTPVSTNWPSEGLPALWRQPIGGGYSSFAFGGGLAFTLEQRREEEAAVAYHISDGTEAWCYRWPGRFTEYYSGEGPRSTPLFNDNRVCVLRSNGDLFALDAVTGKPVWAHNFLRESGASVPSFGCSASPVVAGTNLIILTSAGAGKSVIACDRASGAISWSALDDKMGYATPVLATLCGQQQLIVCAETRTLGLQPETGAVLWEFPWKVQHDQMPIAQPVVLGTNRFLLSAGYFTGCVAVEIEHPPEGWRTRAVWQNKQLKNKFSSSVFHQGFIYGLDEDILTCLDATTGERKGYGQLLLAGDHLVILSGKGELALVRADPQGWSEQSRFPAINGKTWNYPAIEKGRIVVRNAAEMACFSLVP